MANEGPRLLGSYKLLAPLANGGMAEVHLAETDGRHVALKVMDPRRCEDADGVKLLLDEARLVALLDHENIATLSDAGLDAHAGLYYLAMEYVHGRDLRQIMQQSTTCDAPMPLPIALSVVLQAAAGLDHAHRRCDAAGRPLHLVHRDVSLSNLMVGFDGIVKVVDFGIARSTISSVRTRTGIVRGKASYMSPEQCMGEPVDPRTDVFALGVVLYELTTGHRCFAGATDYEKMLAITHGEYRAPRDLVADYPVELESVVRCALSVNPAVRYSSCSALIEALRRLMRTMTWSAGVAEISGYMATLFGFIARPWLDDATSVDIRALPRAAGVALSPDDDDVATRGFRALRRTPRQSQEVRHCAGGQMALFP